MASMTDDEVTALVGLSLEALADVRDADWSSKAGALEWNCWQTADHLIDCIFSYALQIGARAQSGYIPLEELHAKPEAIPGDLIAGLRGVTALFLGVVRDAPGDLTASDGVLLLALTDWCARASFELAIHTHDVISGLAGVFAPPPQICGAILESDSLWMLDREQANAESDPWLALLRGSGRPLTAAPQ
jgi:hypothetical protein